MRIVKSLTLILLLVATFARAGEVRIAVASNFTAPAKRLALDFEKETGHRTVFVFGATGKFYAQIRNGAPFDVLLSADAETPARLEKEGGAVAATRFTYAVGRLALWSARADLVDGKGEVLKRGGFRHLAVASPRLAPYGAAAMETLVALDVLEAVQPKFVVAENIAQAHQFVASGNAELGFVALSQVTEGGRLEKGSAWIVPGNLHRPIRQDAVMLEPGRGNPAAQAWLNYLASEGAKRVIRSYGYE